MDTAIIIILVLLAIGVLLAFLYVITYNKLQKNLIRIKEAEAQIDDALRRRYDILVKMENIINENTNLKQNNFEGFESDKVSNYEFDRKLTKIADTFSKINSDYSDELDTEVFRNALVDLKINEEKNEAAKTYYNRFTTKLNMLIKRFPSNLVARIHGIDERLYFDNKNMGDDDILDFKL